MLSSYYLSLRTCCNKAMKRELLHPEHVGSGPPDMFSDATTFEAALE